jgi:hypothetical protein
MHLHVLRTEAVLKIDQVDRVSVGGIDLAVDEECLAQSAGGHIQPTSYGLEVVHVSLLVSGNHGRPSIISRHVWQARGEDIHAGLGAVGLVVA